MNINNYLNLINWINRRFYQRKVEDVVDIQKDKKPNEERDTYNKKEVSKENEKI
jgi:hypothetical protein